MANKNFMWSHLVHLGSNCWNDVGNTKGREHRSTPCASEKLLFNRELWDAHMKDLRDVGVNTLIVDVADAMVFESHPELALEGSFTHDEMRKEVEKLKAMGFEVIPKLNFSAAHDIWLKEYSYMLGSGIYREVCGHLIDEVCDVFKPKYFHLGMDEETVNNQRNLNYVAIRRGEMWWRDFYHLVNCTEKNNAAAWIWSDRVLEYEDEFFAKMPKSVIQNHWYYAGQFNKTDEGMTEGKLRHLELYGKMDKAGFKQVPAGSVWDAKDNFEKLTKFALENISEENLLGMMQTVWERIDEGWMHAHEPAIEHIKAAIKIYDEKMK